MKKKVLASVLTTMAVGASVATLPAAPASAAQGTRSLATVLAADGNRFDRNWNDFDVLDRAVRTVLKAKPDSAVGVLADGSKRLTAFLPTDLAFRRLVHDLTGVRARTERGTFVRLARAAGVDTIEQVLLYHVVPGATITYRQAKGSDGAALTTAAGPIIRVNVRGNGLVGLQDRDFDDKNAVVKPRLKNVNLGNRQIGHGINRVLRPADL